MKVIVTSPLLIKGYIVLNEFFNSEELQNKLNK